MAAKFAYLKSYTNKASLNTPCCFSLCSALSWVLISWACVAVLVFVYSLYSDQTLPKTALKASSPASAAVSSSALCVHISECNLSVTYAAAAAFHSISLPSVTFTQGQTGRASGGRDAEYLRNVREHLGTLSLSLSCSLTDTSSEKETHIYRYIHTHEHVFPTLTESLSVSVSLSLAHTKHSSYKCTNTPVQ